jgi:LPS-assembly protein
MILRLLLVCIVIHGSLAPLRPGYGATVAQPSGGASSASDRTRVILRAENLEYLARDERLIAVGKVVLEYGDTRLFADRLDMHTQSGIGTAFGQVRLLTSEDDVQATRLDFNLTAEQGLLYDGSGVVSNVYRISGERIARLGPQTLTLQRGRITTCTQTTPDWEFRARAAHIDIGDYVRLKQPSFWVKGVPVFYLPYFLFPIQEERTTGFLPPHFGYNSNDGAVAKTEFFWAISDWMDTTLGLEYLSERGWKPEGEFRYAIDPLSDGQIEGSVIEDRQTNETLWHLLLQQRQEFGWGLRGLTQVDLRSERDPQRLFSRDINLESQVYTASYGALTKRFADSTLSVAGGSFDGIPDSGNFQQFRRLPSLQFEQFLTPLFGLGFVALEASYSRLSDSEIGDNTAVQRLDFFPHLSLPLQLAPWLRFTVTTGVHETLYDHRLRQPSGEAEQPLLLQEGSASRHLFDLRARLEGPALRRRYQRPGSTQAFLHTIAARLDYRYVPDVDQDALPPFDTLDTQVHFLDPLETFTLIDRIEAANYAKVSLLNTLFVQSVSGATVGGMREAARLVLSQGVDFRQESAGGGRLLGPLDVELEVSLWTSWRLLSVARLETATGDLEAASTRLFVALPPAWSVRAGYNYRQNPDVQYLTAGGSAPLLPGLNISYDFRYDGLTGTFREHLLGLHYTAQCWSVAMQYRIRETEDTPFFAGTSFFIEVNLLHL